jgi:protein-L-isoaspartate(D-aspartate) O-methyltransferase
MDFALARFNMIEQQIRPWNVLNLEVLARLNEVKREDYVPSQQQNLAFADVELPLGQGQTMLAPKIEARVVQELGLKPTDRVLEVGTGSAYLTALLASFSQHVYSVEINPALQQQATENLARNQVKNVTLELGDAAHGWDRHAPYDVIVLGGSTPVLPDAFRQQLAVGGRLFAVVGLAPAMRATLITRTGNNSYTEKVLFETVVPSLMHAAQGERFAF